MTSSTTTAHDPTAHGEHDEHVAHHFQSAEQQFAAGKLGMWLFLVTEVLFFGGLFVAYAIYRNQHPEVFLSASEYLNTTLGAINTVVLLFSSLTMAWAVRASQLGQKKILVRCLIITLACAGFFLGVKAVEYGHKAHEGLLWAGAFSALADHTEHGHSAFWYRFAGVAPGAILLGVSAALLALSRRRDNAAQFRTFWIGLLLTGIAYLVGLLMAEGITAATAKHPEAGSHVATADEESAVHHESATADPAVTDSAGVSAADELAAKRLGVFFSIYFGMTGVHAIHILGGMGVIAWLLWRSLRGDFGPQFFGPVDFVGLYWHLVDLIWIYLFPLLYLIG